tara:strand:- start:7 stop:108 length:102 start_codon:yes stop_codon:yes gene_type:complete
MQQRLLDKKAERKVLWQIQEKEQVLQEMPNFCG